MKSNKHILIIPNYDQKLEIIQKKYTNIIEKQSNIEFFSWEQFYDLGNQITFDIYFEEIQKFLKTQSNKNTIIIAEGISASLVNSIDFEFNKKILISPVFAKSYVNPYTTNLPSYKPNVKNYILKIQKEYFNSHINYLNWDQYLKLNYEFYIQHYDFFDTVIAQFGIYENLKKIYKNEKKFLKNTFILSGIYNKQSIFKKVLKYCKKYNLTLIPFNYSSEHLIDEEKIYFKNVINKII